MTGRSRPFDIRLSVKDAEAAIAALRAFGAEGERALRRLEGASKGPTAGMRALAAAKGEASTALAGFSGRLGAVAPVLGALGPLGVAAGAGIAATSAAVIAGLSAWAPYEQQLLRVNAVLKATGSAAGLTQGQIREMAEGVAKSTLATSESALEAAAALATFRTVAGDTFKRTLTLSQDLASVFGGDLRSATVKLAKSLEDPVRGLDSLRESGVSFTAAQKDQIKALVESGQVLKAQGVILDTLQAQVGGAGAAERGGLTGSVKGLSDAWGDLLKEIGSSSIVLGSANILLSALAGNLQVLRSFKPKAEEQAIEDRLVELELRLAKAKAAVTEARLAARQAEDRPAGGISNPFASGPSASALKGLQDQADAIKDVIEVERERLAVIRLTRKEEEDAAAAAGARAQAEQARERAGDNLKALAERIDPAVAGLKAYRDALNIVREAERQGVGSKEDLARIQAILVKAYAETQDPLAKQVRTLLDEAAALEKVGAERERLKALQSARTASPTGEVSPEERLRLERAVNDLLAARARDRNRELEDSLDLAREELRLADALPEVRERELALLKARNDLEKEGVAIGSEEYQQRLRIAGAIADTKAATDVARQAADETARVWTHAGENIQDALRDAFTSAFDASGQKAADFAASFKKLMLSTAAEISAAMVFRPFVGNVLSQVGAPANVVRQFAGPAAASGQGFNLGPLLSAGGSFGSVGGVPGGISAAISIYRLLNGASLTGGSAAVAKLFAGAGNALGGAELGASFGNAGLAFSSPLASIGSFGVNFLLDKLLGNRGIGSSIGSTIGGIAGSFLGPFGSIAGSALGNLLGGLFGGKASVGANANAIVNYGGGRLSVGGVGADNNGDPAGARELADAATKGVNTVLDRLGARLTGLAGAGTPSVQVGYLRGKYFSNVGGSRAEFDDAQGAIADFIRRALAAGTTQGISDDVRKALSRGAATPEELGARIEFAQDYRSNVRRANAAGSARQAQLTGFQIAGEDGGRQALADLRKFVDQAKDVFGADSAEAGAARGAMRNRVLGLLGADDKGANRPLEGLAAELAEVRANLQGFKDALIETGDSAEEAQAKIDAAYVRRTEEARRQIDLDTRRANASPSARQAQLTGFQIAGEENGRAQLQSVRNYLDAAREAYGATDPRYAAAQAAARNRLQGLLGPADTGADRPLQGLAAELAEVRANLQGFKEALIETGDSAEEAQAKIDAAYVRRTEEARRQIGQDTRLALASPSARQAQLVGFQIAGEENGRTQLQSIRNYLDAAREAYGAGDPRYVGAMAAARSRAQGLLGASDEGADAPLDGLAAALAEVRANLQGLKDVLVETGDTAEEAQRKIDEAYVKEVRKRAKLLNEGIGSGLRSLAGNDNVDQAIALKKQIEQEGRDAAAAGIDPTALARLQNQKVSLLLSGWTESQIIAWRDYLASVGELTDDARGKLDEAANRARGREATARALTSQMVVWAGEQSVAETNLAKAKEAYLSVLNDEVSTLEQVTSSFGRFAESLGAFRRELMLSPTYSGLTATGIYQEADRQFTDIAARAQLGDVKAIEQLETISKQFLDASIAVNAKGPQYQTDLQRVLSAVGNTESLAERTFRNNEDALRVARDNLRAAQGVQTNTKSAADLLKDMRDAQAALDTARRGAAVNQLSTFRGLANDFGRDYGAAQSETERRAVYDRYAPLRDAIIGAITDLETAQRIGETWYRGDMSDSGALKLRERVYQLGGLPRFARGGAFTVGGDGGTDTTPVMFMATRGERVEVKTPAQASSDPHASARIEAGLGEMTRQLSGMNRNLKTLGDRLVALEAERSTGTYGRNR